jgi:hypothetical protein
MAGQVGFGIGFDFNALDKATAKADEDLKKLAEGAEEQARRVQRAFSISASQGLAQFAKELTNVYGDLAKFSQYANMEFKLSISKNTSGKVINEINDIVNLSRKKFEELNAVKLSGVIDPSIINNVKELENTLTRLQEELKKGGVQKDENTFVRLSMEGRVAVADEIKAIQERLQVMRMSTSEFNKMKSDEVAAVIKNAQAEENAYNEKLKRIEQEKKAYNDKVEAYRKMFDEIDKMESRTRQANYRTKMASGGVFENTDVAQNAMRYMDRIYSNKGVLSIQNMEKALSKLRDAQSRLNLNTEEGRKRYGEVSNAIKRIEKDLEKAAEKNKRLTDESKKLKNEHNALLETAKKLTTRFAQLFSVQAITGYINKLIKVRGEFEMQHKAMQILVGDVDKANALWDKTVSLAVKSPFKVRDLVTYTKQLSAYRIETDKLFEKTKMLADISSGLGVDMNRLILAYGQVKAANYLRGTELRQFSEAGINVLGELATYFSELEDRAVSVGDVFERVSKRLVSFEDVDAVLQRVTGESGAFYKMQEKQSETLKGMMLNLTDTVELMMNDLGKRNDGVLKGSIKLIREIVENWRLLEPAIASAGTALLLYFPLKAIGKVGKALAAIPAAFSAHPIALAVAGAAALVVAILKVATAQTKLNAALTEVDANITKSFEDSVSLYHELADATNDVTKSTEERNKAYEQLKAKFQDILPDEMLAREQVEALAGDYRAAENAMLSYYNAKALQQKKDRIETMYASEIEDVDIPELITSVKSRIMSRTDIEEPLKHKLVAGVSGTIRNIIDDIKNGKLSNDFDTVSDEIQKRLEKFANTTLPRTQAGEGIFRLHDVKDVISTLTEYKTAIASVQGLPFETYDELVAAEEKRLLTERFDFAKEEYTKMAKLFKKLADERIDINIPQVDEKQEQLRKSVLNDLALLYNEIGEKEPYFNSVFTTISKRLSETAKQGIYEFSKELPKIENLLYTSKLGFTALTDSLAEDAKTEGNTAAATLMTNFSEELRKEGEKKLRSSLQNSIVNAIDYAINKHDLGDDAKDFMAKIIPDSSKTTSDVRNNIEGIIEQFKQLKKEYAIATAAGAEELPFVEWLDKYANSQAGRSMDVYLYGSAKVLARNEELIPALTTVFELLGGEFKGKKKKDNLWDERIKVIDQMNKKFNELNKTLTRSESIQGAFDAYKDAFQKAYAGTSFLKGFNAKQMTAEQFLTNILNFPDKNAIVDFLDDLANAATDADDRIRAEVKKGEYVEEMHVELVKEDQEKVIKDIEGMFGDYDVSLEMEKLNIPPDLAKRLFGVDAISLDDIRQEIETKLAAARATGGQEDYIKELEEKLKKVEDLENKATEERMKKFVKFLKKNADEIANVYKEKSINVAFAEQLFKEGKINAEEFGGVIKRIVKETNEDVGKIRLDELKDSPLYIEAMGSTYGKTRKELQKLTEDLEELAEANKETLSPDEAKAYAEAISKLKAEQRELKPFFYSDNVKKIKDYLVLEKELTAEKEKQSTLEAQKGEIESRLDSLKNQLTNLQTGPQTEETAEEIATVMSAIGDVNVELASTNSQLSLTSANIEGISGAMEGIAGGATGALMIVDEIIKGVGESIDATIKTFEDVKALMDSYGVDTENEQWTKATVAMNTLGAVNQEALQGWENLKNGNIVGAIANTVGSITKLIQGINEYKDVDNTKAIEREAKNIEKLQKRYEKLEKSIDEAYSTSEMNNAYAEAEANIESQIKAIREQQRLEEEKKNTDKDAIEEYQDQLDELEQTKEELTKERVEKAGGTYDFGSVAEQFVDAWVSAFEETGDGLKGLEDEWDEYYKNLVKKQAVQQYITKIMEPLLKSINADLEDNGILDEAEKLKLDSQKILESVDLYMKQIQGVFGGFGTGESELSGLSGGISGITEDQADILAAYWNAVRFSTASIDLKMDSILSKLNFGEGDTSLLDNIYAIKVNSDNIHELLQRVSKSGGVDAINVRLI